MIDLAIFLGRAVRVLRGDGTAVTPAPDGGRFDVADEDGRTFPDYYSKVIRPHLEDLELRRVRALKSCRFRLALAIALGVMLALLETLNGRHQILPLPSLFDSDGWLYPYILTLVLIAGSAYRPIADFKKRPHDELFSLLVQYFDPSLSYKAKGKVPLADLHPSGLVPLNEWSSAEDIVTGSYQGRPFIYFNGNFAEPSKPYQSLISPSDWLKVVFRNRNSDWWLFNRAGANLTSFNGAFVTVGLKPNMPGKSGFLLTKGMQSFFRAEIRHAWQAQGLRRVDYMPQHATDFEKYADTPAANGNGTQDALAERFLNFAGAYGVGGGACCVTGGSLYLVIPTWHGGGGPPPLFESADYGAVIETITAKFSEIFSLVRAFEDLETHRV